MEYVASFRQIPPTPLCQRGEHLSVFFIFPLCQRGKTLVGVFAFHPLSKGETLVDVFDPPPLAKGGRGDLPCRKPVSNVN